MRLFRIMRAEREATDAELRTALHRRFGHFRHLLDANHRVLATLAELEQRAHSGRALEPEDLLASVALLREGVAEIVDAMVELGGERYQPLRDAYDRVDSRIDGLLAGAREAPVDDLVIPMNVIDCDRSPSVGNKNARLGELRNLLGLPVPEGFAITAWAARRFFTGNDLDRRIAAALDGISQRNAAEFESASASIREMITRSPVPRELDDAIRGASFELMQRRRATRFALRSSAIEEDGLLSFAGQYRSFLNVRAAELVDAYRRVIASQYTPKAISYRVSHSLAEVDLAMSVGCLEMVEAAASGVAYSRDPVHPAHDVVIVTAVLGLGQPLVDGSMAADTFVLARGDGSLQDALIVDKPQRMVMSEDSGTVLEPVPEKQRSQPALDRETLATLARHAVRLEDHYGGPQDIEWALDGDGRLVLLQSRPLRILEAPVDDPAPALEGLEVVLRGGTTVCPGAGAGAIVHVATSRDLATVPAGAVMVAERPLPGLVSAMPRISALITAVGGVASHMATLAREYRVPTLTGLPEAASLAEGRVVTVDATGCAVYEGNHQALVEARRPRPDSLEGSSRLRLLREILAEVAPLHLLHPAEPGFTPEACRSFHDITRFAHQLAMEEMFRRAGGADARREVGLRLRTTIPLQINLLYLDEEPARARSRGWVGEDDLGSPLMQAFWSGVREEGWPAPPPVDLKGFMSVVSSHMRRGSRTGYSEDSYAILGRDYMNLSLRMGYHFTTFESVCTAQPGKNYIRVQYKHGGASIERRIRRVRLISEVLGAAGFESFSKGDFLDSRIAYLEPEGVVERLLILGRLAIMTKQLDMALSSDAVTDWYARDFMRRLGLDTRRRSDDAVPAG